MYILHTFLKHGNMMYEKKKEVLSGGKFWYLNEFFHALQQGPEVRLPLGQGIAGHVASTGQIHTFHSI